MVERIEGGRGLAGDAEGVEDVDRAEGLAGATGDPGIFALGVDADHGAVSREQVRDDGSHPFACARRGHRQQMGRTVIAKELSGLAVAADQQAGIGAGEGGGFLVGGEAGRAVGFAVHIPEMDNQRIGEEAEGERQQHQQRDEIEQENRNRADAKADLFESEAAAEADDEQDDNKEEQKPEKRFPDAERCGEQSDERP